MRKTVRLPWQCEIPGASWQFQGETALEPGPAFHPFWPSRQDMSRAWRDFFAGTVKTAACNAAFGLCMSAELPAQAAVPALPLRLQ